MHEQVKSVLYIECNLLAATSTASVKVLIGLAVDYMGVPTLGLIYVPKLCVRKMH